MSDTDVQTLVVGAGVVGLACARALALSGRDTIIVEAEADIGTGTSSRNSEVIHAGIYYRQSSLKARLCTSGKWALYDYCKSRGIPHNRLGKLIVAQDANEVEALEGLAAKARANGVDDIRMIDSAAAQEMEPNLRCVAALHSPSSGIIDSHQLMLAYLGEAEDHGAALAFNTRLACAEVKPDQIEVTLDDADQTVLTTRELVIAGGLSSITLAHRIKGLDPACLPSDVFVKGNYFKLNGKSPFSRLIYPAPGNGGLGIHLTLDLAGQARFGPDTQWEIEEPLDFEVEPERAETFYQSIRRYWPDLPDDSLVPDYSGMRPKIRWANGQIDDDFRVLTEADHRIPGLICLLGIESPGLTASLALGDHVTRCLEGQEPARGSQDRLTA